jgi:hypothetical protein
METELSASAVSFDGIDARVVQIYLDAQKELKAVAADAIPKQKGDILNKFAKLICDLGDGDALPLNFDQASRLDGLFFEKAGRFWRTAYDLPHDGDKIALKDDDSGNIIGNAIATNCGILTMSIVDHTFPPDTSAHRDDDRRHPDAWDDGDHWGNGDYPEEDKYDDEEWYPEREDEEYGNKKAYFEEDDFANEYVNGYGDKNPHWGL